MKVWDRVDRGRRWKICLATPSFTPRESVPGCLRDAKTGSLNTDLGAWCCNWEDEQDTGEP